MGKLRLESKHKPLVDGQRYKNLAAVLKEAQSAAKDNQVYWDLDKGEKPRKVRDEFLFVAAEEGISVNIRQIRKSNSLIFKFEGNIKDKNRMSAEESRNRIIASLEKANRPLRKAEIVELSGISPSTWNLRIKELLRQGKVKREGERRESVYALA